MYNSFLRSHTHTGDRAIFFSNFLLSSTQFCATSIMVAERTFFAFYGPHKVAMSSRQKQLTLQEALHCAKCNAKALAEVREHHSGSNYSPGEIVLISCSSPHCKERQRPWFFCNTCQSKGYRNGLTRHIQGNRHTQLHAQKYPPAPPAAAGVPTASTEEVPAVPAFPGDDDASFALDVDMGMGDVHDVANMDQDGFCMEMERDLAMTHVENGQSSMDVTSTKVTTDINQKICCYPKIPLGGNEWLAQAMAGTNRATTQELFGAFGRPELSHMKNFWVAEHGTGEGRCGGGLIYLAARAFQQVKTSQLDPTKLPNFDEARWQFDTLVHYHSMNDKQRRRQARINKTLMDFFPRDMFFKATLLPPYNQLGRYYGNTGQHSMWNNLPCPRAIDIDGVAYVSPRAVIAFVMANAIPIDDIFVTPDTPTIVPDHLRRVHNVDENQKSADWFRSIRENYYGSENGAPNSNLGAPKFPGVVCLHLTDWTDGFDSAKVKSNRNAVDSKTFSVSAPKCLINSTDNTFAVALGLKKAKGWLKVESMFRQEIDELCQSKDPIPFYNGALEKLVPCMFKQYAVLSDKQERNGLTGTLGCGSDLHRCFGVAGKVETPSCLVPELEDMLKKQAKGTSKVTYGWSHEFVSTYGNLNGTVLPSCPSCRKSCVRKLLQPGNFDATQLPMGPCKECCHWDLTSDKKGAAKLEYAAHKDYPTAATDGSPIPPPKGRDVFAEGLKLPFIQINWALMIQASKFAFYQASRPARHWTKATTTCYLKNCGISQTLADSLYAAAREAKGQDDIDYHSSQSIGGFTFHPAWQSKEVSLRDFIEAVMHQLFLGAAESNYELIGLWLSATPSAAKLGYSSFLAVLQVLLKDLRPFNLSWLLAYPLTGKKGKLGTGSWVAENWVSMQRISQFAYGWCFRDEENASKYGAEDMSRVVNAFHAFVARCLTHAGIDFQSIAEADLYLKEFLSALREFDIRVRYNKLNKQTTKVSERKGTEAWWLKPNYMSLCNLISMMCLIGPLVLWWDGGGKGERFIQIIKPHIKKGIREDAICFFTNLLEKLYRVRQLDLFEKRFGLDGRGSIKEPEEEEEALIEIVTEIAESLFPEVADEGVTTVSDDEDGTTASAVDEDEEEVPEIRFDEAYFSPNEAHGMTKNKTIYVYRNEKHLNECIRAKKPLAGMVEVNVADDGETAFEFYVVFRKPVKQFARRRVVFDDGEGLSFNGLWCAGIQVEDEDEAVPSTTNFQDIQSAAKLAAVALPLWYVVGKKSPDCSKYCVITNWWKNRMSDGTYRLPTLDPKLYNGEDLDAEALLAEASRAPKTKKRRVGLSSKVI